MAAPMLIAGHSFSKIATIAVSALAVAAISVPEPGIPSGFAASGNERRRVGLGRAQLVHVRDRRRCDDRPGPRL